MVMVPSVLRAGGRGHESIMSLVCSWNQRLGQLAPGEQRAVVGNESKEGGQGRQWQRVWILIWLQQVFKQGNVLWFAFFELLYLENYRWVENGLQRARWKEGSSWVYFTSPDKRRCRRALQSGSLLLKQREVNSGYILEVRIGLDWLQDKREKKTLKNDPQILVCAIVWMVMLFIC